MGSLKQRLGSPQSQAILGSGGYVWPAIRSLDPLFLKYWAKNGIDMSAFLTEAHGQVVNFPVSPGIGDALTEVGNDLGPAWLGTESVSQALKGRPDRRRLHTENQLTIPGEMGARVTVGDDTRPDPGDLQAERSTANSPPLLVADPAAGGTGLILFPRTDSLPAAWVGAVPATGLEPGDVAALLAAARPCPLLPQHGEGWFGRPGLSGHRLDPGTGGPAAGRDWSPLFRPARSEHDGRRARVEAADKGAGLGW